MKAKTAVKSRNALAARRGFTLVEILCVVVILAIASAIVVPQMYTPDDLNASAGARAIVADLLYAQNRAISTQQMQYVSFNVAGQSYALYGSMAVPLTPLTQPATQTPYAISLGPTAFGSLTNCSLSSANFAGQSIVAFDESGVPYSYSAVGATATSLTAPGTIVIASGANSLTISVAPDTGDVTCN